MENFYGNAAAAHTLEEAIKSGRIPQTILLAGPEGTGKATLARRFAAVLLGGAAKIEQDDLSLPQNRELIAEREKWTSEKRAEAPLLFASQPDFVTFAPEGPLRQLSIPQMRLLRERAPFRPLAGSHRVFLIDHLDRANEQAANSLLKVLEEPPPHLIIVTTVENVFDLLPTIRSRVVVLQMGRLSDAEMRAFARARGLADPDLRLALAEGCPGVAASLNLEEFRERRALVLSALECGAELKHFAAWVRESESFGSRKSEKLDFYLKLGYGILEDILAVQSGAPIGQNRDVEQRIGAISRSVGFAWIERAVRALDELVSMVRRNIQKTAALDAMIINLRNSRHSTLA
ncbi:MAG: ATP-binding protein [Bryobacteraceae bacterium]